MRHITLLLFIVISGNVCAQDGQSNHVDAMAKLNNLTGYWEGQGWIQQRDKRSEFRQTEDVQLKLDGTTLLIEGNGYVADTLIFQAMAVISYDAEAGQYRFNSFLADGKYVEAEGKFNDDGSFDWQFEVPNGGIVKYNIVFTATTWQENGSYSPKDVEEWYPFMGMSLTKTTK